MANSLLRKRSFVFFLLLLHKCMCTTDKNLCMDAVFGCGVCACACTEKNVNVFVPNIV